MSNKKQNLIVCAHPDDETIYFAGLIMQKRQLPWKVICITNGNADNFGDKRHKQFEEACFKLKVLNYEQWDFPDIYEQRLNTNKIISKLSNEEDIEDVFTHGIIGEYGHPHHQDVSYAVHQSFKNVYSVSYNCFPDKIINLTEKEYKFKTEILHLIYGSEINRFAHLVSGTWQEGFTKVASEEINEIYNFVTNPESKKAQLDKTKLEKYLWLYDHIIEILGTDRARIF